MGVCEFGSVGESRGGGGRRADIHRIAILNQFICTAHEIVK